MLVRRCARQWPRGHALHRRPLERRLLVAVSPWAGDVLPCLPRRPAVAHTRGAARGPSGSLPTGRGAGTGGRARGGLRMCTHVCRVSAQSGVGFAPVLLGTRWSDWGDPMARPQQGRGHVGARAGFRGLVGLPEH